MQRFVIGPVLASESGVPGGIRTLDPLLRRQPLYPLSYRDLQSKYSMADNKAMAYKAAAAPILLSVRRGPSRFTRKGPSPIIGGMLSSAFYRLRAYLISPADPLFLTEIEDPFGPPSRANGRLCTQKEV